MSENIENKDAIGNENPFYTGRIEDVEEHRDIYIKIEFSKNFIIEKKEANLLLKDKCYYTIGQYEFGFIYIFDLEKNSILPEVRFLDHFNGVGKGVGGFNPFGIGFIFILVLVGIFLYFNFGTDKEIKTNNIVDMATNDTFNYDNIENTGLIPVIENKDAGNTKTNIGNIEDNNYLSDTSNNISNNSSDLSLNVEKKENCDIYKSKNLFLNSKIDILNLRNISLVEELESYKNIDIEYFNNIDILKNRKEKINKELLKCQSNLSISSSLISSENELFKYIGKNIFELCEEKQSDYCIKFVYKFYNDYEAKKIILENESLIENKSLEQGQSSNGNIYYQN